MLPRINSKEAATSILRQLLRNTKAAYLEELGFCPMVVAFVTPIDKKYYSRRYFKDESQASTFATLGTLGIFYNAAIVTSGKDTGLIRVLGADVIRPLILRHSKENPGAILGGIIPVAAGEYNHLLVWTFCDELRVEYTMVHAKDSTPPTVFMHPMEACCRNIRVPTVQPLATKKIFLPESQAIAQALKDHEVAWNPNPEPMSMETLALMHKTLRDAKPEDKLGAKDEL